MNINAGIFTAYLRCPTKCFLRAHGETGSGNEYADWVRAENERYRLEGLQRLMDGMPPGDCVSGTSDTENLKAAKWRLATDLAVCSQNLESRIHAVERIPPEGRGRSAQYVPIRFIFNNKLTTDDKLLAAYDALVWSEASGRPVTVAKIIHGDDHSTLKVKTGGMKTRIGRLAEKIAAVLAMEGAPDLVLNRHCGECEFQTRCREMVGICLARPVSGWGEQHRTSKRMGVATCTVCETRSDNVQLGRLRSTGHGALDCSSPVAVR